MILSNCAMFGTGVAESMLLRRPSGAVFALNKYDCASKCIFGAFFPANG
jgi:hypothetical protein